MQSSLLKYREFAPFASSEKSEDSDSTGSSTSQPTSVQSESRRARWTRRLKSSFRSDKQAKKVESKPRQETAGEEKKPVKKMPVLFLDEAHKLYDVLRSHDI